MLALLTLSVLLLLLPPALAQDAPTKDECVKMCKKASALVTELGVEEALKQIGTPGGEYVWKGTYVFAVNVDLAIVAAHPANPKLVGKTLMGLKDVNGKMFFAEFISVAKGAGEGWVDYYWPKPGEKTPSAKESYVLKVPNTNIAVIAGIYK